MAKANRKAREAGLGEMNFNDFLEIMESGKESDIKYLNPKLVLDKERIKRITQAEADKKKEKRIQKCVSNMWKFKHLYNIKHISENLWGKSIIDQMRKEMQKSLFIKHTEQINHGFDIARKWKSE